MKRCSLPEWMLGTISAHSTTTSPVTLIRQTSFIQPHCKSHPFPPSLNQSCQLHQAEPQRPRRESLLLVCLVEAGIVGVMPSIRLARSATTPTEPASMRSPDEIGPSLQEAALTSSLPANRGARIEKGKRREKCKLLQLSNLEAILVLVMNHIQCPVSADRAPVPQMHRLDRKDIQR
jgi:hypothetical protein